MLKILQARLQQYINCELPDVQSGFRKGRGTRDQISNIHWIIEKARVTLDTFFLAILSHSLCILTLIIVTPLNCGSVNISSFFHLNMYCLLHTLVDNVQEVKVSFTVGSWTVYTHFSSVHLLSCVQLFATPWTAEHQASLSVTNSQSLLKLLH